jgi:hypothetical protein
LRNFAAMRIPNRSQRWAEDRADYERSIGIEDREPITDDRDVIPIDLRKHGGDWWQIEPRLGYASCRLRNMETGAVEFTGTMKQVLRHLSRRVVHRLGARNLQ